MDVAGGSEAESTSELGGEVGDDVAEKVIGNDDVELARIADELHGEGVDVKVAGLDVGIFGADGFENALPEVAGEGHSVGFVGHAKTSAFASATANATSVFEGVAKDAFDAFAGIDVFLGGDFVGRSLFEEATGANIDAFGVFPEDDEANIVAEAILERGEALVEQLSGAGVDEEIELKAKAEEDVGSVLIGGDAGIAESAEEDGVEFIAKHFDAAFGERDLFAQVFVSGPVEFNELDGAVVFGSGDFDGFDRDGSDFFADAVTGNDGDAGAGTAGTEGDVGHESGSKRVEWSTR